MTLLDKVKTLIKYAKFGMGLDKIYRQDIDNPGDLYFPKPIDLYPINSSTRINLNANLYIRSIKGRVKIFGGWGGGDCKNMGNLEEIDLPECTTFYVPYGFAGCTKLHTVKLPAIQSLTSVATFDSVMSLKYIEFGTVMEMHNQFLLRCTELETVVVGKGTTGSLYLHYSLNLTQECLHNIIDNLADMSRSTTAPTLQIGTENLSRISEEYINKLYAKNWNLK